MPGTYRALATRDLPRGSEIDMWNAFGSETLSNTLEVDPEEKGEFNARLSRLEIGDLGVVWMETSAATARCRSPRASSWAVSTGASFLVTVQEAGQCWFEQGEQGRTLLPGDIIVRGGDQPWTTRSRGMRTVTLKLPIARLAGRIGDPAQLMGSVLAGSSPSVRLASSIILSIKRSLAENPELAWDNSITDIVLEALGLACEQRSGHAPEPAIHRALWRDIREYVDYHLDDPALSVVSIADATGQSVRSVQRLFVTIGNTPSRYILERRLDRAAELLRDTGWERRENVTGIAYSVGFNELSYFSRAFAQRFGMSPRAYRKTGGI